MDFLIALDQHELHIIGKALLAAHNGSLYAMGKRGVEMNKRIFLCTM